MTTDTRDATVFPMPSLGADMTEGRITEWLVAPGDEVERGQIVVVVETDKSDIEVEVFEPGVVVELLVDEGERVPVGTPIARIDRGTAPPADAPGAASTDAPAAAPAGVPTPADDHVTSPVIRHLADELHVDATRVAGTGPGGRVRRDDVERAAHPAPAERRRPITPRARRLMAERGLDATAFPGREPVTGDDVLAGPPVDVITPTAPAARRSRAESMRAKIAELMARSWAEIPHYHVSQRLDVGAATERLQAVNEDRPLADRIVLGAFLLAASARAARAVPSCNGWWRDGRFVQADDVHVGLVLSLRSGGIIVPTIRHADRLTADETMARLSELVQRARQGRLRASDMAEATITVTNLGERGADAVTGVIHPPQVALVGFGAPREEVWVIDGDVCVRPTVHASLAGDHRAMDGLIGSRFLAHLQTLLDGELPEECS